MKSVLPAEIELICAVKPHPAFPEKIRQHPVGDGGAHLGFDVIADDGQAALFESLLPVRLRGNENRNAIDKRAAGLQYLLDIPLRRHLRADRQIGNHHIRPRRFENANDVIGRSRAPF